MPKRPTFDTLEADHGRAFAQRRVAELDQIRAVLRTEAGRGLIWRLLERCALFQVVPPTDRLADYATREGERAIGAWLLSELELAEPGIFANLMMTKKQQKEESDDAATDD